jgi:hypothetical protein
MQKFFNTLPGVAHGTLQSRNWEYAKSGILRNIDSAIKYYSTRDFTVKSQHLLVRILHSLGVSQSVNFDRYYDIIDYKALRIGSTFGLTSSISYGDIHEGIFFGPNSKEIIIAINESFNHYDVYRNWKTMKSVNVIAYPRSDLGLMLGNGKDNDTAGGISVITINIAMLAIQYRAFCYEQYKISLDGGNTRTASHFVHQYILPNMLYSQVDIAIFNRFSNLVLGAPMSESKTKHPFFLLEYDKNVDEYLSMILKYLESNPRDFENILQILPSLSKKNMQEVMVLPNYAPTKQMAVAEIASRIDVLNILTLVAPDNGTRLNQSDINFFLREFKSYSRENIFNSRNESISYFLKQKIKDIQKRVGGEVTF